MRVSPLTGHPPAAARVAAVVGEFLLIYAAAVVLPAGVAVLYGEHTALPFLSLAAASAALALVLRRLGKWGPLDEREAMATCAASWLLVSLAGAWPFYACLRVTPVDAVFESVSGFTTTGMTVLSGLDRLPRSLLFWRCFTQYLGGIGILTFFLFVGFRKGTLAHRLFSAEGRHLHAGRPTPSVGRTVIFFVVIYLTLTATQTVALRLAGVDWFDSLTHAMTTIATAGFSNHDQSVAYYAQAGYPHAGLIEGLFALFMILSGMNFLVLYRVGRGQLSALWDGGEIRWYWGFLVLAGLAVSADVLFPSGGGEGAVGANLRAAGFQVAALTSTTGLLTRQPYDPIFGGVARQTFLLLMLVGACVGSTGGGLKMMRAMLLARVGLREMRRATMPGQAVTPLIVDGKIVEEGQVSRVAALGLALLMVIGVGALAASALAGLSPADAFSVSVSAVSNIGPTLVHPARVMGFPAPLKLLLAAAMFVGRLEVFPVIALLSRRTWR